MGAGNPGPSKEDDAAQGCNKYSGGLFKQKNDHRGNKKEDTCGGDHHEEFEVIQRARHDLDTFLPPNSMLLTSCQVIWSPRGELQQNGSSFAVAILTCALSSDYVSSYFPEVSNAFLCTHRLFLSDT